jgi:TetR/AcrR family transcriptional regulator, ethionamide resistance regulator
MTTRSRDELLSAAERLLERTPLHSITVQDILREATVSRRTFYIYFSSKFDVIAALLARTLDEMLDGSEDYFKRSSPAEGPGLLQTLRVFGKAWHDHAAVMNAVVEHSHAVPELESLWRSYVDRFVEEIATRIECDRAAGSAPAGVDARKLATGFAWSGERLFYVATRGVDSRLPSIEDAVDTIYAMWVGAVYGEAVGPNASA